MARPLKKTTSRMNDKAVRHRATVLMPIILAVTSLWMLIWICLAMHVSLKPVRRLGGDVLTRIGAPNPAQHIVTKTRQKGAPQRELKLFQDITIGEFQGEGSINVACFVELPDWWYEMNRIPKTQKMLMKMTTDLKYAAKEVDALKHLNADQEKARRLKMLPLIVDSSNLTNPFYCDDDEKSNCSALALPETFPIKIQRYLRREPRLAAFVVPFADGKGTAFSELYTLDEVRHFMKSMLGQLAHAHSMGINYLDLSGNRNVFADHDGSAILFDWNGALAIGEKAYNPDNNFGIIPPEAWMEQIQGHEFKMMSVSAWDVWSAGVIFAHLIFYPCRWATSYTYPKTTDRLKETILAIGGNTVIPVDEELDVDLAGIAGLDEAVVRQVKFKPQLVDRSEEHACSRTTFEYLENSTEEEKKQALDFLQSMMKISPLDRPNCDTLLKHPFLN